MIAENQGSRRCTGCTGNVLDLAFFIVIPVQLSFLLSSLKVTPKNPFGLKEGSLFQNEAVLCPVDGLEVEAAGRWVG